VTLIDAMRPADWQPTNNRADCAEWLGLSSFTGAPFVGHLRRSLDSW